MVEDYWRRCAMDAEDTVPHGWIGLKVTVPKVLWWAMVPAPEALDMH